MKDKIKKGTFDLLVNVSGTSNVHLLDSGSAGPTIRECPTGEFGLLFASSSDSGFKTLNDDVQGIVFYEAGVAVVSPYIFSNYNPSNDNPSNTDTNITSNKLGILSGDAYDLSGSFDIGELISTKLIDDNNYALASHIKSFKYNSITELNSTIYFCRAYNHEFNYSSNPTYLQNSKIVVKGDDPEAPPRTYITTVGLYSDDNQLLAVAKLSEPILKSTGTELIARVRLDF